MNQVLTRAGTITAVHCRSPTEIAWLLADATIGVLTRGGRLLQRLAEEGRDQRHSATTAVVELLGRLVSTVLEEILDHLDRTGPLSSAPVASTTRPGARVPDTELDPAVAEWVDRVFHRRRATKEDSG
ncbi:MAG: hypothetical protein ACRDSP_00100 [Pseudonocardiaceae bacterium]